MKLMILIGCCAVAALSGTALGTARSRHQLRVAMDAANDRAEMNRAAFDEIERNVQNYRDLRLAVARDIARMSASPSDRPLPLPNKKSSVPPGSELPVKKSSVPPGSELPVKKSACKVTLTEPSANSNVARTGLLKGTARLPPGTFLWVLAHRRDLARWWPQGDSAVVVQDDATWTREVAYGQQQDVSQLFEVGLAVVSARENQRLEEYVENAVKAKDFPPIRFPQVVDGCAVKTLIVKKTAH